LKAYVIKRDILYWVWFQTWFKSRFTCST